MYALIHIKRREVSSSSSSVIIEKKKSIFTMKFLGIVAVLLTTISSSSVGAFVRQPASSTFPSSIRHATNNNNKMSTALAAAKKEDLLGAQSMVDKLLADKACGTCDLWSSMALTGLCSLLYLKRRFDCVPTQPLTRVPMNFAALFFAFNSLRPP